MFQMIPLDQLHPAIDNVRRKTGDVRDLAASIASVGIVEPLLVTPRPDGEGGYTVVAGHRRLAAARAANLPELPCTIRTLTDAERVEIMVAENLARTGLTVIEEAAGYFRMAEFGLTAKDLAKRLGRSAAHVRSRLALLELPKAVQAKLDAGTVTVAEGTALLALKDDPDLIAQVVAQAAEPFGRDIERSVVLEVARLDTERKAVQARADLEAQGVTIIEQWDRWSRKKGDPVAIGTGHGELEIPARRHAKEPCHAAHITRTGDTVFLCAEPARHAPDGPSRIEAADPASGRAIGRSGRSATDEDRQRRKLEADRTAFAATLTAQRLPKADVLGLVLAQLVHGASASEASGACQLLAIDPEAAPPASGTGVRSATEALATYAADTAAHQLRACLAIALTAGEAACRYLPSSSAASAHTAFLTAFGWAPEDISCDGSRPAESNTEPVDSKASGAAA